MKKLNLILGVSIVSMALFSCKKNDDPIPTPTPVGNTKMEIRMTDAPGPYDAVYIDLRAVEITGSAGETVMLNVHSGIYNLLDFSNGLDTLIASATLPSLRIEQIRLILGSNNTVVVNGIPYPLSTPSAEQSGLKLQVHKTLQAGVLYSVLLDFDANQSIILQGNGTYKLKPVIRTIETAISGAVRGHVLPAGINASVNAITSPTSISYYSNVAASGDFLVMGLPPGMYAIIITPPSPFIAVVLYNITVTTGVTTDIGTVTF